MIDDAQWAKIHASLAAFDVDADAQMVDEHWWLVDPVTFLPLRFIEPHDWTTDRARWPLRHGLDKLACHFSRDQERSTPLQEATRLDVTLSEIETLLGRFNTDWLGTVHFSDEADKAEQALEALAGEIRTERDRLEAAGSQSHTNARNEQRHEYLSVLAQLFDRLTISAPRQPKPKDLARFLAACTLIPDAPLRNFVYRDR